MRPPELHVMLVGLGRSAQAVDEVQQSAVFLVPAGVDGTVEDGLRLLHQVHVSGTFGVLKQEPDTFDIVARIDDPALGHIQTRFPFRADVLQDAAQVVLHMIAENVLHAGGRPFFVQRLLLRVDPHQHGSHIQIDHRDAEGSAAAGLRNRLRAEAGGIRHAVVEVPVEIIGSAGA